jgi:metacaspase-1
MSWAFQQVLLANPQQSYTSLLRNLRTLLAQKYSQKPVLSASHPIDTSLLFII